MNFIKISCLIFILMHFHILVTSKCKKTEQVMKKDEDKGKQIHRTSQDNETTKHVDQHKPIGKIFLINKSKTKEEKVLDDKASQNAKTKEINKAQDKNEVEANEISLPIKFAHSNKFRLPTVPTSPSQSDRSSEESELGYNGDLYDVFKKRLNQVFRELYNNVNTPAVTQPPPQVEIENDKPKKRSAVSNCLYEEFKRRLDKFNNEFMEPTKAIKRTSGDVVSTDHNDGRKRTPVTENLYDEYKKLLDNLGDELRLDGEKVLKRGEYGASGLPAVTTPKRETTQKKIDSDKAVERSFYDEYKKKLDELTRELYKKSNERICRTYGELSEYDLTSPTLQRLVAAVQSEDAKVMPGNFEGSTILLKIDKAIDNIDKEENKRSLGATELGATIFGADSLNFMTGTTSGVGTAAGASYPAVLTKSVDANLGLLSNTAPKNLLATVASKMNMTTLDLAKKLAAMSNPLDYVAKKDPQLGEEMQKFIDLSVNKLNQNPIGKKASLNEVSVVSGLPLVGLDQSGVPAPLMTQDNPFGGIPALASNIAPASGPATVPPAPPSAITPTVAPTQAEDQLPVKAIGKSSTSYQSSDVEAARIAGVLDKVLSKLEYIQSCKAPPSEPIDDSCEPDGMPCDVVGSWNSYQMGLRFDITLTRAADRRLGTAEKNNKLLTVDVGERIPPHAHHIIETSWKFMGSALNQQGGPFYLYSQNRELSTVATFIGYCRVCGGIDTIFGSWTIMGPSKDCEDITTALENRRDIFRRYNMENKRNQHFKDMLFEKSKYSKADCDGLKKG
ncbi:uncharacterized protein LOC120776742 [Bactrocera tryoni]|uniref:uncharacterized protein LOC120776742 n=1 Tax=Bactrocera tryoni TaxID=59916 RepID=UPI001A96551A|nr:uncharacterized protein LOC120776742 [Bactrocera tryoni]